MSLRRNGGTDFFLSIPGKKLPSLEADGVLDQSPSSVSTK